jgi:subtilisin family serine protease
VRGDLTALYGTSFAAPVVSGYAAVLGSKFTKATPTQIANRLLDSARTDTITGYDVSIHGQGEASITRALAPASIN